MTPAQQNLLPAPAPIVVPPVSGTTPRHRACSGKGEWLTADAWPGKVMLTDLPKFPVLPPCPARTSWGDAALEGCPFLPTAQRGPSELALSGETPQCPGTGMSQRVALHLTIAKRLLILT